MKNSKEKPKKSWIKRIVRFVLRLFIFFFLFFVLLVLFIRSPWGQNLIVDKVADYVSKTIGTPFEIDSFYLTFSGNLAMSGVYLEDEAKNTLLFFDELEIDIPLLPIVRENEIHLKKLFWSGLEANIYRTESNPDFNYQYIIDAFASEQESKDQTDEYNFKVSSIDLADIQLRYVDDLEGLDVSLVLGNLNLNFKKFDLEELDFQLNKVSLHNTDLAYLQKKISKVEVDPLPDKDEEEFSTLPLLGVASFQFDNLAISYIDENQDLSMQSEIGNLTLNHLDLDLNEDNYYLDSLLFADSFIEVDMPKTASGEVESDGEVSIEWPQYNVEVREVELVNNRFQYTQNKKSIRPNRFDTDAIALSDFNMHIAEIKLRKEEKVSFELHDFNFKESSGFYLQNLSFDVALDAFGLSINSFNFKTPRNAIGAELELSYKDLTTWVHQPTSFQKSKINLNAFINIDEFILLYPSLKEVDYVQELAMHPLNLKMKTNGNSQWLAIDELDINWASTRLSAQGVLSNLDEPQKLGFDLKKYSIYSLKNDISNFVSVEQESFSFPETISLSGAASGNMNQLKTNSKLEIPEGLLIVDADVQQGSEIRLNTALELIKMDLGKLLNQPDIKPVSLQLVTKGKGKDWFSLDGELKSNFSELTFAEFDLSDLSFDGKIKNKDAQLSLGLDHPDIRFTADAAVEIDTLKPKLELDFNLKGIDLKELRLSSKNIRAKTRVYFKLHGNQDDFDLSSSIDSTLVVHDNQSYELGKVDIDAMVNQDRSKLNINSRFLTSQLNANAKPQEILKALSNHFEYYLSYNTEIEEVVLEEGEGEREENSQVATEKLDEKKENSTNDELAVPQKPVDLQFQLRLHETPFISDVLLEGLQEMDTLIFSLNFDEKQYQLTSNLSLPKLIYKEIEVDSLNFNVETFQKSADFDFSFKNLNAGAFGVAKTRLYGNYEEDELFINFDAFKEEMAFFSIQSKLGFGEEEIHFKLLPENLILNEKPWEVNSENWIKILQTDEGKEIQIQDFDITRNQQYFGLRSDLGVAKNHVGLLFKDFKLSTLTSYLNTEEDFAKGIIAGELIAVNPFGNLGIISDLQIENLEIMQNPMGLFTLKAESDLDDHYQLCLDLDGDQIQFNLKGDIANTSGIPHYTLQADLRELQMQLIEKFGVDYLADSKGKISALFNLEGSADEYDFNGNLSFVDAQMRIKMLNAIFKLGDEKIEFDKKNLLLKNFTLRDSKDNAFSVDGKVAIGELQNPKFDLLVKANNFEVLNSTKKDNDLYYGKVIFDANFKVLGDLNFPKIEGELSFKESTDITYNVPQTQVGTVEREGIVLFVNKKNPDDILTRNKQEGLNAIISGIELKSILKIHPKAKAKVVINRRTGDNVRLQGGGDFKFNMARNGNMNLSGKYEVQDGQLELNLYNLVTRRFKIAEGSSIAWSGDPYNADLDIRAIYEIETAASSLMASQTSAESNIVQNQFRQQLPFQVYLDVGGEINAPQLSFQLDMPESDRAAINGTVYNRVMQINQQEDELNKQVFSLLVLNRFYPSAGSDGSQGGAASLARNNLNQALSDQLNTYANKLTGNTGIQLNFDVNSYTDFQSGQGNNRTDVDVSAQKKMMNDRLIVEAGSQVNVEGDLRPGESNVALGNVSVQYLITQDGRWKVKGFRRSEYENVIDGQVFISGIALIFTREFNRFKELWAKGFMEDDEEEDTENEQEELPNSATGGNTKANLPIEE